MAGDTARCYVMAREQVIFDHALPDLFGFYALQWAARQCR
jgi:hypothetical protein